MAIVFPASPSVNDTFTAGSITYTYDGSKWIGLGVTPTDRLIEGNNNLQINASNELIWTGGSASFAGGAAVIASSGNLSIDRTTGTNDILNGKLNGTVTSTLNANGLIELGSASNSTNNNGLYLGGQNGSFNLYTTRYTSDCFQILNTSGSGTNVALRAYGNGDVEIAGTIQTNTKSAGNIELDSTGAFTSPKIKLFANTGNATFAGNIQMGQGKGIDFSANANATGMTSELLDDYEEGTFSPDLEDTGSSATYTSQNLNYIKTGRMVMITGRVQCTRTGTGSGVLQFRLPFAADNNISAASSPWMSHGNCFVHDIGIPGDGTGQLFWEINSTTHAGLFYQRNNQSWTSVPTTQIPTGSNGYLTFTMTYRAAA